MTRATLARALFATALAAGAGSERGAAGGTQFPIHMNDTRRDGRRRFAIT